MPELKSNQLKSNPEKEFNTVEREILRSGSKPEFKAAVGLSRQWDARKAGREVANRTLEKLGCDPDFFLLFSTIHYEKYGGFQEFLDGVWEVLPEGTPLIGGTVAGFINNYGCFTRGATALAVSYPNMDVAVGVGRNTKRNPKKAARECAGMIKNGLKDSRYENKFLIDFISGGLVPNMFPLGKRKVIRSGLLSRFVILLLGLSQYLLQRGVGREDEILEELTKKLPNYSILSGSLMDDIHFFANYQFFNRNIFTNSIVALGLKTDLQFDICTTHGMKKTNISFDITKLSKDRRIIHEINHKPAALELLRLMGWPEKYLSESIYRRVFYYPLGFEGKDGLIPEVIVLFLENSILLTYKTENLKVSVLNVSGKDLLDTVERNLAGVRGKKPKFGLVSSCAVRLETLSYNIYTVRNHLLNYFKENPFLLFYANGEAIYTPKKGLQYTNETFNSAIFWK